MASVGEKIVADTSEIHSSIFDHKPNINKEINYFIKEFEEKRQDSEVYSLFTTLELLTELKETEIPVAKSLSSIHLPNLGAQLLVSQELSQKLISKLINQEENYAHKLKLGRDKREKEWENFVIDMTNRCIKIDKNYKEKEEEVRKLYLKAEQELINKI